MNREGYYKQSSLRVGNRTWRAGGAPRDDNGTRSLAYRSADTQVLCGQLLAARQSVDTIRCYFCDEEGTISSTRDAQSFKES